MIAPTAATAADGATDGAAAGTAAPAEGWRVEAERQRGLLAVLWGHAHAVEPGLAGSVAERERGCVAYRANAAALAARVLTAAYPTVAQLLGGESLAALARAYWHRQPPQRGDMHSWGAGLPEAIQADPQLRGEAYLADVARLDWAVHCAGAAEDDEGPTLGLELLASSDPAQLLLRLRAGSAVLVSPHPIVEIWQAHQQPELGNPFQALDEAAGAVDERFAKARQALQEGQAQAAWITRVGGCAVQVLALHADAAHFTAAVLGGSTLEQALLQAGAGFSFEAWLILTLRHRALAGVQALA